MGAQPSLFQTNSHSLGELAEMVEQRLTSKCQVYHASFGIFKTKRGNVDHNALVIITNNAGRNFTISMQADSMRDLFAQVNDALTEIAK